MEQDKCRTCGATVFWGQTKNGKQMPVDWGSNPFGTIRVVVPADPREPVQLEVVGKDPTEPRYTSHFATCPQANLHRKQGRL